MLLSNCGRGDRVLVGGVFGASAMFAILYEAAVVLGIYLERGFRDGTTSPDITGVESWNSMFRS